MMTVYIVIRNDNIDSVFLTQYRAQEYINSIKGWNLWKIVEKDIEDWYEHPNRN